MRTQIRVMSPTERLKHIAQIIEAVDKRAQRDVPPVARLTEMTPSEISSIYALASTPFAA